MQAPRTTFFDYVWENVFLTTDNLLIPCKIWDERKRSLDCEKSLPSHREVKVLSQTLNCTSEVLSIPPETEGPGGWTPVLLIAPAVPVNKYFPISPSVCLSVSLSLSFSPTKVSRGGGSFDYLRCGLIAFLNLCTDLLPHRPRARRTCPDGPPSGEYNKPYRASISPPSPHYWPSSFHFASDVIADIISVFTLFV